MKLLTEIIKSKLIEEQTNFEWNKYTHNMINDLIELCNELKGQELRNIDQAFRSGFHTTDRWALDLEVYHHILTHYHQEILTFDEFEQEKKRVAFFKKNFAMKEVKMPKQTAVEWLFAHLVAHLDWSKVEDRELFRKLKAEALAMEKEQICQAVNQHYVIPENYYYKTYHSVDSNEMIDHIGDANKMVDQVPDVRNMVEDDVIDWLINKLENHIVLSAHGKLGTNRTGDYRIGLRKAIDFCHQAKEMEAKETLYTEEQIREAIDMARTLVDSKCEFDVESILGSSDGTYGIKEKYTEDKIIQLLKQPKKD